MGQVVTRLHPRLWQRCTCDEPEAPHYCGTGPDYIVYNRRTRRYSMVNAAKLLVGEPMTAAEANAWAIAYRLNHRNATD